jgi:CelD/BcsL family acetyltransferase involved in cellulose biosynthesis
MPWAELRLEGLREQSPALSLLPALLDKAGFAVEVMPDEVSPHIPVTPTWDGYLESLNKKDRHELRRKLRRLESAGHVRLATHDPARLQDDVTAFLALMKDSREEKAAFMTAEREGFFRDLAQEMDRAGLLKLFFLELDSKRLAGAYCFDYDDRYFLYNSGFDTSQAHLSGGLLLKALLLKDAIERGKKDYDLLRGAEPYKYHIGAQDRMLSKLVATRRGPAPSPGASSGPR